MIAKKRKRGRPLKYGERTQRYQVTMPRSIAVALEELGQGSLSGGIVRTYRMLKARAAAEDNKRS